MAMAYPAVLSVVQEEWGLSSTAAGSISSAYQIGTAVAQRITGELSFAAARSGGYLDRNSTSQLLVIGDEEYAAGLRRLEVEQPVLRTDLRLHATTGWT